MNSTPPTSTNRYSWLKLALKIVVTGACVWYISTKIDFGKAGILLQQLNGWYLFPALIFFTGSKLISAVRLQRYFTNIQLPISASEHIRLYWLGMFYNLFLPGAISGDIYKIILLSKQFKSPYKKLTAAVLLDRISGLLGLGILLAGLSFFVALPGALPWILTMSVFAATGICYAVIRYFFPDFLTGFNYTLLLGLAVQVLQLICAYLIMCSLGIRSDVPAVLFIFLLSSAVSVLPITIGGLGIRELVFLQGANWFQISVESAVLISLVFYLLTLITSVWGAAWLFKSPFNEKGPSDEPLIF